MAPQRVRNLPMSIGLGAFLALSYVVCTVWDGLVPSQAMHGAWEALLPGFTWWSWSSFYLGLVETFAYGFWLGLAVPAVAWANRWRSPAIEPARPVSERSPERAR